MKIITFFKKIANERKTALYVLIAIVALGVFLRAYKFHDLQVFDDDQTRDAAVIDKMAMDKNFMIMGPYAYGTDFYLGPGYYYLEYATNVLTGNSPGNLAYPTLFFSILSLPLFFFFLKKFFSSSISLVLTTLYSVSFYSVVFSRFAWNPNPLPFFILSFFWLLFKMVEKKEQPKIIWPILAGIIIGVGIQLHTLAILIFLPMLIIYFIFFLIKKYPLFRSLLTILAIVIFLNIPQIVQDINNKGTNTKAFIYGVLLETDFKYPLKRYLFKEVACWAQGNEYVLTPVGNNGNNNVCEILQKPKNVSNLFFYTVATLALFFFGSGIILFLYYLRKENDYSKQNFLRFTALYFFLSFAIIFPMAFDFAPRYFLVIFFLPFIFLGFWFKFLTEKLKLVGIFIVILISLVLISANLWMVEKTFLSGQNPNKIAGKAYPGFSLRNAEMISNYILNKAANYPGRNIYVYASKVRYLFSARYFIDKNAKNIKTLLVPQEEADQSIEPGSILFYIQVNSIMQIKYDTELYRMLDSAHIDSYDILVLEKK